MTTDFLKDFFKGDAAARNKQNGAGQKFRDVMMLEGALGAEEEASCSAGGCGSCGGCGCDSETPDSCC